ncbi:hypothetical protein PGT21_033905 [Puccinia graminis f. sp. tritici]|uniref:Uncharacterized protein n=1 Tax=Puccinia graminis f. sp. tritici TaxID=56615 RepID=A0A5B0NDZ9_PUCGR|nr:hypothetical protein PGT21_033905 [Puccinia graminis f. sp. tritici]
MTRPLPATDDLIKLHKHWNLRPGLALQIEDALKEKFLEIPHPIFDSLARLMMYTTGPPKRLLNRGLEV